MTLDLPIYPNHPQKMDIFSYLWESRYSRLVNKFSQLITAQIFSSMELRVTREVLGAKQLIIQDIPLQQILPATNAIWTIEAQTTNSKGTISNEALQVWVNTLDPSLNLEPWTKEEDPKLKAAIAEHGHCWSKIAALVPSRTDNQCRRYGLLCFYLL
ncbi:uncharacterized protein LOC131220170 [Magnolia sinica]|uniref:uncharacterized protein LOC131220170 n=1 Tax=Magnolia sinica TaxID=86752 RepID=UPI002658B0FA|nr:uncharacterized protein LOC131220170 [Magnolia sinica]